MNNYSAIEKEVICLRAVWDQTDDLVNYELFEKLASQVDALLMFKEAVHQRIFNVLLCDFLSNPKPFGLDPVPRTAPESEQNLLFHLGKIAEDPVINRLAGESLRACRSIREMAGRGKLR